MRVKRGETNTLRVVDRNNDDIDEDTPTPVQRKALARAREALLTTN